MSICKLPISISKMCSYHIMIIHLLERGERDQMDNYLIPIPGVIFFFSFSPNHLSERLQHSVKENELSPYFQAALLIHTLG